MKDWLNANWEDLRRNIQFETPSKKGELYDVVIITKEPRKVIVRMTNETDYETAIAEWYEGLEWLKEYNIPGLCILQNTNGTIYEQRQYPKFIGSVPSMTSSDAKAVFKELDRRVREQKRFK